MPSVASESRQERCDVAKDDDQPTAEQIRWSKRLKALRAARGWDQIKAAEELGISQGQVSNIENCRYLPNPTLQKLIDCKLAKSKK